MALVRRMAAVGRAQVSGTAAPSAIPHQGGVGVAQVPGAQVVAGQEMAAAVPSHPGRAWAVLAGLGLAGAGGLGAWNITNLFAPGAFDVGGDMSVFAALFVFSAAVERVLEPFTRWLPGRREQDRYEKAVADMENGVPGATNAAAHYKAAVETARGSRAIVMWGLATGVATIFAASTGFYLLRMISANPGWNGIDVWVDALLTGLVVGSGTKPLHDIINRVQQQSNATITPV